jgi:anti-anti-sigma factor
VSRPGTGDSASELSVSAESGEYAGRPGTVVRLAGRAAGAAARQQLREAIEACARQGPQALVADLAQLESIDSPALRELVKVSRVVSGLGGTLALACPQPDVEQMLLRSGTDQQIPLFGSAEEALAG